jgi:trans-2,3-dihydro-3-hydroxyanthranilate isomerase
VIVMPHYRFHTLDVFTTQPYTGNPLAVVLEADGLSTEQMQTIAREFNLSETVFVQQATRADALARLRIFTPAKEMPFAGHPTVGTACLLAELYLSQSGGEVDFVLEENVGPVPVKVRRSGERPPFAQLSVAKLPEYGPPPPPVEQLAAMLGLPAQEIVTDGERPRAASCGVPFLLVPVRDIAAVSRARPDPARCREVLRDYPVRDIYLYAHDAEHEDAHIRARMFAPELGIAEDPATGAASVALAGALALEHEATDGSLNWTIEQGVEMGRPSLLYTEADKQAGQVTAVRVGGHAVRVSEGQVWAPE